MRRKIVLYLFVVLLVAGCAPTNPEKPMIEEEIPQKPFAYEIVTDPLEYLLDKEEWNHVKMQQKANTTPYGSWIGSSIVREYNNILNIGRSVIKEDEQYTNHILSKTTEIRDGNIREWYVDVCNFVLNEYSRYRRNNMAIIGYDAEYLTYHFETDSVTYLGKQYSFHDITSPLIPLICYEFREMVLRTLIPELNDYNEVDLTACAELLTDYSNIHYFKIQEIKEDVKTVMKRTELKFVEIERRLFISDLTFTEEKENLLSASFPAYAQSYTVYFIIDFNQWIFRLEWDDPYGKNEYDFPAYITYNITDRTMDYGGCVYDFTTKEMTGKNCTFTNKDQFLLNRHNLFVAIIIPNSFSLSVLDPLEIAKLDDVLIDQFVEYGNNNYR